MRLFIPPLMCLCGLCRSEWRDLDLGGEREVGGQKIIGLTTAFTL